MFSHMDLKMRTRKRLAMKTCLLKNSSKSLFPTLPTMKRTCSSSPEEGSEKGREGLLLCKHLEVNGDTEWKKVCGGGGSGMKDWMKINICLG